MRSHDAHWQQEADVTRAKLQAMKAKHLSLADYADAALNARDEYAACVRANRELRDAAARGHRDEVAARRRYASALRAWKVAEANEMVKASPTDPCATPAESLAAVVRAEQVAALELEDAEAEMAEAVELVRL